MLQDCIFHRFQRSESELPEAASVAMAVRTADGTAECAGNQPERIEIYRKTNHALEEKQEWA